MNFKNIEESTITKIKTFWDWFHKSLFYLIIFVTIGLYSGFKFGERYFEKKMDESIMLQAMVYKNKVYSIQPSIKP